VEEAYNNTKDECWEYHSKKSVQSRIQVIEKDIRKLNSHVRQVKNLHPSGTSDKDIAGIYFVITYTLFVYIYLQFSFNYF